MPYPRPSLRCGSFLFVCILAFPFCRATAQTTGVAARITQAIDEKNLVNLKGNVHPLARPEFDQGPVADAQPLRRMLLLLQRSTDQEAALRHFLDDQQSKSSPNYHAWLTPDQFGKQFGPADADIQTVSQWLTSHGFTDIHVGPGRAVIEFSGNVAQVRAAFHTEIHHYIVAGEAHVANASDPQIPAALAPVVAGLVSLHNFPSKSMRHEVGSFTQTKGGDVIPQFTGANGQFYALGPADFAKIYNIPSSLNGTGSKIGIVGVSDINVQDVSDFRSLFGLPANVPSVIYNGPNPGANGAEGEADLDVQWSGAVAQGAHIDYVVSEGTLTADPLVLSALYVIDNNSDDILSVSFGSCEKSLGTGGNALFQRLWEQAAAQGITVTISAGDAGSAGCDDFRTEAAATAGLGVSGFASTPFNIAVGGTDFDDSGRQGSFWSTANAPGSRESALGYIPETSWNDSCSTAATSGNLNTVCANPNGILAGSGGPSGINAGAFAGYAKPSFQNGVTPTDGARDIPDISLFASVGSASESFYVVCQADRIQVGNPPSCAPGAGGTFSFLGVGGTSASAPSFAGILALIEQSERSRVPGSTGRQGNANFALYKLAATAANSCNSTTQTLSPPATCVFYDVTKGNNSVPCAGGSPNCSSSAIGTNGVLVDPNNTSTPAWTTGTGYDYATGLGTLNVANLISKWGGAVGSFKATTASLSLNGGTTQVNITHGASVTAAVTVAPNPGPGTPTGDVSLLTPSTVGANEGGMGSTLTSGATSFPTTTLPGGSYNITAHYSGDGTFAPSDSNGVPVVVAQENSRLQAGIVTFDSTTRNITSTNATSFAYGSPYVLRFDILNGSSNACQPLVTAGATTGCAVDATGTVTITDNGAPLDQGTFPVNSGGNGEDQPIQLVPGSHPIVADYSGDNSYKASVPATLNLTVTKGATTTTLTGPTGVVAIRDPVPVKATVSTQSSGVAPNCTAIVFNDGSTVVQAGGDCVGNAGSATVPAQVTFIGVAVLPATLGIHTITATYPGDAYYTASTSSPQSVTVKLASFLAVTANPVQVVQGQSTTLTALVDTSSVPPTPSPTGTVQFSGAFAGKIGNPVNCTATTDPFGNEACQASVSFSPTTTDNVTATYGGDANYAPFNTAKNTSVVVVQPSFSISGSSATALAGGTGTSMVTVTPIGFTGMVTVTCQTLPPGVTCSPLTINETNASTPASGALTINVAAPSTTTTASIIPTDRIYVAQAPQTRTKPWWPWRGGAALALLLLLCVPRRQARAAVALGLIWALSFTESCGGGAGGGGGGGGTPPSVATSTQLSVSSIKVAANGSITVSATVSGGTPNGSVQFVVDGAAIGGLAPLTNGTTGNITLTAASAPAFLPVVGTHSLSAQYVGTTTTQASHSGSLSVTVTGTTSFAIAGTSTTTGANGNISLTIN
jgi:Pro-kumamolisin, activation domain/Bacterial Ig-like domain (group 3)